MLEYDTNYPPCSYCGEGCDPMAATPTQWQCSSCEQWNDKDEDEPDLVEITDAHVEHMRLWAGEPNMSILEMMKSVELLQEILRITKKEPDQ